jgi:hypothetical protein
MHLEKLNIYHTRTDRITKDPIQTPPLEIGLLAVIIAVGKMKSGKSLSISSKLRDLREQGYCDRVFLLSPTAASPTNKELFKDLIDSKNDLWTSPDYASVNEIIEEIKQEGDEWDDYLEQMKIYNVVQKLMKSKKPIDEWDPDLLLKAYDYNLFEEKPKSKYGHLPRLHWVCDDVQSSQVFTPSVKNPFLNAVIKHRHIGRGVSIWVSVQNFSGSACLPKQIRAVATHFMIWRPNDLKKREQIAQEISTEVSRDKFLEALDFACSEDSHDFLLVDLSPKGKKYQFRKNWDELILF